jgi:hypothetical protein
VITGEPERSVLVEDAAAEVRVRFLSAGVPLSPLEDERLAQIIFDLAAEGLGAPELITKAEERLRMLRSIASGEAEQASTGGYSSDLKENPG